MLLFLAGLILLAIWVINLMFPSAPQPFPGSAANKPTARERIFEQIRVRGELSREQPEEKDQAALFE